MVSDLKVSVTYYAENIRYYYLAGSTDKKYNQNAMPQNQSTWKLLYSVRTKNLSMRSFILSLWFWRKQVGKFFVSASSDV